MSRADLALVRRAGRPNQYSRRGAVLTNAGVEAGVECVEGVTGVAFQRLTGTGRGGGMRWGDAGLQLERRVAYAEARARRRGAGGGVCIAHSPRAGSCVITVT